MQNLRFRQVHLDFHTSEAIRPVGDKFDARQFQEALKRGHVDSVTLFAKCHHGMSYHDTKIGERHPGLNFELLPRQIEACRAIDVKCPIYISAGLDELAARQHPEWVILSREGKTPDPLRAHWKELGWETPYLDYLCAQIAEVVERFGAEDGVWLDIVHRRPNFSSLGLMAMEKAGIDPREAEQVRQWSMQVLQEYYRRTTAEAKRGNAERRVFHNAGHIAKGSQDILQWQSHLELESLPTGGWGYDHFPISAKYAATTGFDYLGMTGKFHTSWGEFGGFKRANALRYECAAMLAFGAKCSIGDQLHPSGEMNPDTYDLIGAAYAEVEQKEAWCTDSQPVSDIALVSPEGLTGERYSPWDNKPLSEEGASRMLLELGAQFDVVDSNRDLSGYKVVIIPDEITLEGEFLGKIQQYLRAGGRLLLSGTSGMTPDKTAFALELGLSVEGKSKFNPDYIVPTELLPTPPVRGPFVIHGGAWNVNADENWQVLARRRDTYFNREWNHFCSHSHTPDSQDSPFPAALFNGQVIYFAHSIFTAYRQYGQPLYRDLVKDALALLLPNPVVSTTLPSAARCALRRQEQENRYIMHLLFAVPQKRGADAIASLPGAAPLEMIEDLYPLHNVECHLKVPETIRAVTLAPSGKVLEFQQSDDGVRFIVPQVLCHQMLALEWATSEK
jgi:hypothetical protein